MDAIVTGTVVTKESLGNLSPLSVTFFAKDVPVVPLTEGERLAILRFKTDKETKTKRANMAVKVFTLNPDEFTSKPEFAMIQGLLHDYHDSVLVRCANGEITQDQATSKDWIVTDYFDTSRDSNGRKITKEAIAAWFAATMSKTVEVRAITKNAQMTAETLKNVLKGYSEMFQKMTGYNIVNQFQPAQIELLKLLMVSTEFAEDDSIAEYILLKLNKATDERKAQDDLINAI